MAGDYVPQSSESIEANGESAGFNVNGVRDSMRLLMWPSIPKEYLAGGTLSLLPIMLTI